MKAKRFLKMNHKTVLKKHYLIVLSVFIALIGTCFQPVLSLQNLQESSKLGTQILNGQILFAPLKSTTTYLIDRDGTVIRTWESNYLPNYAVYLSDDGTLLRSIQVSSKATHGGIEKYSKNGTVIWHYEYYSPDQYQTHHDFEQLPNGHILMVVSEIKNRTEAINAGRDPNRLQGDMLIPDYLVEIEPTGHTSGNIVWEWHAWDHLIQDFDRTKENYGVVEEHPELMNINYGVTDADWLHCNTVAYNEQFDQILLTFRHIHEIWVIDHSTNTTEAAGHTGGNSGKGGDILYRWGNPITYNPSQGANNQKLYGPHDAQWIKPGYPGEGHILIFNNGLGRMYSSVDEIIPPVNSTGHYYLENGSIYKPDNPTWSYVASPPTSFYAEFISGAERLQDGNTLICNGPVGKFFEVTPQGTILWQYTNPYPETLNNRVFKIQFIPTQESPPQIPNLDCKGSLAWTNVKPKQTVYGSFQIQNIGTPASLLNWSVNLSSITWGTWTVSPQNGMMLTPEQGQITVQVSVVAPEKEKSEFQGSLRVENLDNSSDFAIIPVYLKTPTDTRTEQITNHHLLFEFMDKHSFIKDYFFLNNFFKIILFLLNNKS